MTKIVNINETDSKQVKELYYKYNASLDIISYLMSQTQNFIKQEHIQNYLHDSENKFMVLEDLKNQISLKYLPEELKDQDYNYTFDFIHSSIIYSI